HDPDRHAQHAASRPRIGLHRVHVSRRARRVRQRRRVLHEPEAETHRGLHHRTLRLSSEEAAMAEQGEFTHHFSSQFNNELATLRSRVMAMGSAVEKQLADAVIALETNNDNMARSVIGGDLQVNALEVYLDEESRRILARRQPAAGDLRLIFAVIKAVTDIERIGDQAKSV